MAVFPGSIVIASLAEMPVAAVLPGIFFALLAKYFFKISAYFAFLVNASEVVDISSLDHFSFIVS